MGIHKKPFRRPLLSKLAKEVESNLTNAQFGVDSLAQSMGMSRSSLHRKLQRDLGVSTSQFIREYRLKRALEILQQEDCTSSETAYRVGFSSATYFSTCFHKFYGYTPGEVKSRINGHVEEENEEPIHEMGKAFAGNSENSKSKNKKTAIWVGVLLVLLSGMLFFYNASSKEYEETLAIEKKMDEKSIAVLPFKNLTGKPDLEYVSDGMTDAVVSRLAKIGSIDKVIPFTSTLQYKETEKTIEEIAKELGVENLLHGNLQISGNKIKINLQLVNGRKNEHIWSEEYTREWKTDEIFKMQTEVVEGIATNLNAFIANDELAAIKKIPTKSKQAYSYYLQGEFQRQKGNELSYSNAINLYEKSIEADSNFVEPYIDIANVWHMGGSVWGFYNEQVAWNNAKAFLEQALNIEPTNRRLEEELNTGRFFYDWNFELVEKFYRKILRNSILYKPSVISLDYLIKTGRPEEALKAIEYYTINDPSNVFYPFFKAEAMFYLGSSEGAKEILTQTDPLFNDNWFYLRESTKLYFYLEEYEESKIQLGKILSQFSDYPPILMWFNAIYAQMDGNSKEVITYLAEIEKEYDNGSSGSPAWFLALYYCSIEDYDEAFDWLKKSYDRHEVEMTWLREEPLLAPVRNDSRYKELYYKIGFSSINLPIKAATIK